MNERPLQPDLFGRLRHAGQPGTDFGRSSFPREPDEMHIQAHRSELLVPAIALPIEPRSCQPHRLEVRPEYLVEPFGDLIRRPPSVLPHHRDRLRTLEDRVGKAGAPEDLATHMTGSLAGEEGHEWCVVPGLQSGSSGHTALGRTSFRSCGFHLGGRGR